ncbi:MAG: hypothetical protein RLZZ450_6538 [Pseudomonadota bacterium]|jgi:hypothetical protein
MYIAVDGKVLSRRVVVFALLLFALGCGEKAGRIASRGDAASEHDNESRTRDAGSTRDGGKPGSSGTSKPGGGSGADAGSVPTAAGPGTTKDDLAPKVLMQVDDCASSNEAGLSAGDVDKLKAGGKADGMSYLYPYDATIFPRGFKAPLLMWKGGSAKAVYLKIRSKFFEYDGCLKPTAAGQLQLPQKVWDSAGTQTLGPTTPFTVELSTLDGGKVSGPIKERLIVAQATFKGSIYYNSYDSKLGASAGGGMRPGGATGTVLRIQPGKDAEFYVRQGTCTGCHAVSANGQRLVSKELGGGGGFPGFGGAGAVATDGQVYNILAGGMVNPTPARNASGSAFVGLTPDGALYVTTAVVMGLGPNTVGRGVSPLSSAVMYETDTGTVVPNTGIPAAAGMPTFSADGTMMVFSDLAKQGNALVAMDFDLKSRKASGARTLHASSAGHLGWPFLLPDNAGVIFAVTESVTFSGEGAHIGGTTMAGPKSDLSIADAETGKGVILARAMGFDTVEDAAAEKTYLPFGSEELHQHYYPTVSPVAAGGYFWVFFDSIRHYGNLGIHRSLWATAVKVQQPGGGEFTSADGLYGVDHSSPAFYVPGQELDGANHRAFTALDPCKADGQGCESGIDCCSGFCTDGTCGPPKGCSELNEACKTDEDCCDKSNFCIGGYCGVIAL